MHFNSEYFKFFKKKRLRFFSFFFALSFLFWIITKLSNPYRSQVSLKVRFVDIPSTVVLNNDPPVGLIADITASGFELLIYNFFKSQIDVSLADTHFLKEAVQVNLLNQKFQLEQQLYQSASLNLISPPQINLSFNKLKRKRIAVLSPEEPSYRAGYNRSGDWLIKPDSLWVIGPDAKVDTLKGLMIERFSKVNIDNDIYENLKLVGVNDIKFEQESVLIEAKVNRFTERSMVSFINIKNLPDSLAMKLFPQSLEVSYLVPLDRAVEIQSTDFKFYCDFIDTKKNSDNSLKIFLENHPSGVQNIRWKPEQVDYLIRK
ncbi:MAG: hypothetical protein CMC93_03495 [Flavobacteriaceae bacterium]|nr:hypothetical protein [Flavobacteriaceae bacterium]